SVTISGQVDQGASANKEMRLTETMKGYSDDGNLTYDTTGTLPSIDIKLAKIPNGTLDGTLNGDYSMTGDLEADVTLNLTFAGQTPRGAGNRTRAGRRPGTTHTPGTATSGGATYNVDVTH